MVTRRVSAATAMPLLALAACGVEREATRGNLASSEGANESNGNVAASGREYECSANLSSPINSHLQLHLFERPQSIRLRRIDRQEGDSWTASGHLDGLIHREADQPFPASARAEGNRLILEWSIHSDRVTAVITWQSDAQDRGNVQYDVTFPPGTRPEGYQAYRMRGECVEYRRHPFTAPLGRNT